MNNELLFSSQSEEWATPQDFFDQLKQEFNFGLDVSATEANTKCPLYFDKQQDGLAQDWTGIRKALGQNWVCWMNPPYGRNLTYHWVKKAWETALAGTTVVCLLPARTDTKWYHEFIWDSQRHAFRKNVEVRFIKGRLKFGSSKDAAPFPSIIVVFRKTMEFDIPVSRSNDIRKYPLTPKDSFTYFDPGL